MSKACYERTYIYQLKQDNIYTINKPPKSMLYLQITNIGDKNDMVSQMAHAKNLGEPFMAHLENLYNIPCKTIAVVHILYCCFTEMHLCPILVLLIYAFSVLNCIKLIFLYHITNFICVLICIISK